MFTIGDFARHGRVSIRMLRHYDAIGLLRPAQVDPANGYRFYAGAQLARLNRVIALKDLGFTLAQVQTILDEQISVGELRGMLRLRRAELAETVASAARRLAYVEARLRTIESEGHMPGHDVVVKHIDAVRVAELTGIAAGYSPEHIAPVIQPLFAQLSKHVADAGVPIAGPAIAYYESSEDGESVLVHAAVPVAVADIGDGIAIVELPAFEAATLVHRGSMDEVMPSYQALSAWIEPNGYRSTGVPRELYLDTPDDPALWVTELQEPVTPA
jgi:DNA-binding transcriptional MerR regulator